MWMRLHAFPTAVLTASGLKGIISAERHPQAKCYLLCRKGTIFSEFKKRPPETVSVNCRRICKPSSVLQTVTREGNLRSSYHLSGAAYPPATGEQPLITGIHGLAGCSRIPLQSCQSSLWALTPLFHPYRSNAV